MSEVQIAVPDLGDFDEVSVIEVLVKAGDVIEVDTPLVTLETEKATMDVLSPQAGVVAAVNVKAGDSVDVFVESRESDDGLISLSKAVRTTWIGWGYIVIFDDPHNGCAVQSICRNADVSGCLLAVCSGRVHNCPGFIHFPGII